MSVGTATSRPRAGSAAEPWHSKLMLRRRILAAAPGLLLSERANRFIRPCAGIITGYLAPVTPSVPAPASAVGYDTLAWHEEFDTDQGIDLMNTKAAGFNLYVNNAWPGATLGWDHEAATPPGNIQVSGSTLTLDTTISNSTNSLLNSAVTDGGLGYRGFAASGGMGFYIEYRFQMPDSSAWAGGSFPALWLISVETFNGHLLPFVEIDLLEFNPGGFLSTVHDWNLPDDNQNVIKSSLSNAYNTWGLRVLPQALNSGTGQIRWYLNGTQFWEVTYSTGGVPSPGLYPNNRASGLAQLESQHFMILVGTGPTIPIKLDWIRCWTP
jgi:hypothetical protein